MFVLKDRGPKKNGERKQVIYTQIRLSFKHAHFQGQGSVSFDETLHYRAQISLLTGAF